MLTTQVGRRVGLPPASADSRLSSYDAPRAALWEEQLLLPRQQLQDLALPSVIGIVAAWALLAGLGRAAAGLTGGGNGLWVSGSGDDRLYRIGLFEKLFLPLVRK